MKFFDNKWPAILLWPFSFLYGLVVGVRNFCYDNGIFKSFQIDCKVVSIGNITVGGTGKTPMVQYVVGVLSRMGKRVAIVSRGYGRTTKGHILVSDGEQIFCSVDEAGDEPYLLARTCKGVVVSVDEDRVRTAKMIVEKYSPDVIVLDDAMQHRRLKRDLDIVMIRAGKPFGNGWFLPSGPLRDSLRSLKRAHIIVARDNEEQLGTLTTNRKISLVMCDYHAVSLNGKKGEISMDKLNSADVYAFCGIAHPEGFYSTLTDLNVNILEFRTFQDHHNYSADDVRILRSSSHRRAAQYIITTEKDWVKLPHDELDEHWLFVRVQLVPRNTKELVSRFEMLF